MERNDVLEKFERFFPAGTTLFREGDEGNEMYVLRSGKIELTKRLRSMEKLLGVFGAGDFLGEMAILNDTLRTATARVVEDARLLVIDGVTFEDMLIHNAEIALRMIKKMAGRLSEADDQIATLLFRDSGARIVHALGILCEKEGGVEEGRRRLLKITDHELAMMTGLDLTTVSAAVERLSRAGLVNRASEGMEVAARRKLEDYLDFLDMKSRVEKS